MAFDSLDAFLNMGGHGPYVWTCYFVFFALSIVLVFWSRRQRESALRGIVRRQSGPSNGNTVRTEADFARVDSSKR